MNKVTVILNAIKEGDRKGECSMSTHGLFPAEAPAGKLGTGHAGRLLSVDSFRGVTIIGMIIANTTWIFKSTYDCSCFSVFLHGEWHGVTFADMIFPFFVYIMGLSVVLSLSRGQFDSGRRQFVFSKVIWRTIKLFLLGVAINALMLMAGGKGPISVMGVLQRIGLVYLACVLLYLFTRWRTQLAVGAFVLLSYWLAMAFIPVPSIGTGILEPGRNLAAWMDQIIQPGALNAGTWDSEGLFSTIPAVATGITGMLAGYLLISSLTTEQKVIWLFLGGFLTIVIGQLWGLVFPLNKWLWTSSFVLFTSGWASVTLASFTWLIRITAIRKWSRFSISLGKKSLFCYVLHFFVLGFFMAPLFGKKPLMELSLSSLEKVLPSELVVLLFSLVIVAVCYGVVILLFRKTVRIEV